MYRVNLKHCDISRNFIGLICVFKCDALEWLCGLEPRYEKNIQYWNARVCEGERASNHGENCWVNEGEGGGKGYYEHWVRELSTGIER
jgi:hypothetical protein